MDLENKIGLATVFPEPFGPTTSVSGQSKLIAAGLSGENDLIPRIYIFSISDIRALPLQRGIDLQLAERGISLGS